MRLHDDKRVVAAVVMSIGEMRSLGVAGMDAIIVWPLRPSDGSALRAIVAEDKLKGDILVLFLEGDSCLKPYVAWVQSPGGGLVAAISEHVVARLEALTGVGRRELYDKVRLLEAMAGVE